MGEGEEGCPGLDPGDGVVGRAGGLVPGTGLVGTGGLGLLATERVFELTLIYPG